MNHHSIKSVLIGLLIVTISNPQPVSSDVFDAATNFFADIFGWSKYGAHGILHVQGQILLPNGAVLLPTSNGSYWSSELRNATSEVFYSFSTSVHIMLSLFYVATGVSNPAITIQGYYPCTNFSQSIDIDYSIKFDRKNVTPFTESYYNLNSNGTWTLATLQSMVNKVTTILADPPSPLSDPYTWKTFVAPFTWKQVVGHEIRAFDSNDPVISVMANSRKNEGIKWSYSLNTIIALALFQATAI